MSFALPLSPAFMSGMVLSLSLIMAIGPQNAHVLRMGLQRQHLMLTITLCVLADVALIALGVLGLAQLGGLSDKLHGALIGAGVLFLGVYGWQAMRRFLRPQHLAPAPGVVQLDAVERDQELLAAEPGDQVVVAHVVAEHSGDLPQHFVADEVAELIVDALEQVHVGDGDAEWPARGGQFRQA